MKDKSVKKKASSEDGYLSGLPSYERLRMDFPEPMFLKALVALPINQEAIPDENALLPSTVGFWNVHAACARRKVAMMKLELDVTEKGVARAYRDKAELGGAKAPTIGQVEEHVTLSKSVNDKRQGLEEMKFVVDLLDSLVEAYTLKASCLVSAGAYDRQERELAISAAQVQLKNKLTGVN
jgi:hypothetical protein